MSDIMTLNPGDALNIPRGSWAGLVAFRSFHNQVGEIYVNGELVARGKGGPYYVEHKLFHGDRLEIVNGSVTVYGKTLSPQTSFAVGIAWGAAIAALTAALLVGLG